MSADDPSHEILTSALGLLTATHADRRMAGPVTRDYLAGMATDRSQLLSVVSGMTALATMLIEMRARGDRRDTRGDPGGVGAADPGSVPWAGVNLSSKCGRLQPAVYMASTTAPIPPSRKRWFTAHGGRDAPLQVAESQKPVS